MKYRYHTLWPYLYEKFDEYEDMSEDTVEYKFEFRQNEYSNQHNLFFVLLIYSHAFNACMINQHNVLFFFYIEHV